MRAVNRLDLEQARAEDLVLGLEAVNQTLKRAGVRSAAALAGQDGGFGGGEQASDGQDRSGPDSSESETAGHDRLPLASAYRARKRRSAVEPRQADRPAAFRDAGGSTPTSLTSKVPIERMRFAAEAPVPVEKSNERSVAHRLYSPPRNG